MYCGKCGKKLPDEAKFCNECGHMISERKAAIDEAAPSVTQPAKKSKPKKKGKAGVVIAVILLLVLAAGAAWWFLFGGNEMFGGKKNQVEVSDEVLDEIIALEDLEDFDDPLEITYAKVTLTDEYELLGVDCKDEYITIKAENKHVIIEAGYIAVYYDEDGEWVLDDVRRDDEYCEYGHGFTSPLKNITKETVKELISEYFENDELKFDEISIEKFDQDEHYTEVELTVTGEIEGEYVTAEIESQFGVSPDGWYIIDVEITDSREAEKDQGSEIEVEEIEIPWDELPVTKKHVIDTLTNPAGFFKIESVKFTSYEYISEEKCIICSVGTTSKYSPAKIDFAMESEFTKAEGGKWTSSTTFRECSILNPEILCGVWEYTDGDKIYVIDVKNAKMKVDSDDDLDKRLEISLEYYLDGYYGAESIMSYVYASGDDYLHILPGQSVGYFMLEYFIYPDNPDANGWYYMDGEIKLEKTGKSGSFDFEDFKPDTSIVETEVPGVETEPSETEEPSVDTEEPNGNMYHDQPVSDKKVIEDRLNSTFFDTVFDSAEIVDSGYISDDHYVFYVDLKVEKMYPGIEPIISCRSVYRDSGYNWVGAGSNYHIKAFSSYDELLGVWEYNNGSEYYSLSIVDLTKTDISIDNITDNYIWIIYDINGKTGVTCSEYDLGWDSTDGKVSLRVQGRIEGKEIDFIAFANNPGAMGWYIDEETQLTKTGNTANKISNTTVTLNEAKQYLADKYDAESVNILGAKDSSLGSNFFFSVDTTSSYAPLSVTLNSECILTYYYGYVRNSFTYPLTHKINNLDELEGEWEYRSGNEYYYMNVTNVTPSTVKFTYDFNGQKGCMITEYVLTDGFGNYEGVSTYLDDDVGEYDVNFNCLINSPESIGWYIDERIQLKKVGSYSGSIGDSSPVDDKEFSYAVKDYSSYEIILAGYRGDHIYDYRILGNIDTTYAPLMIQRDFECSFESYNSDEWTLSTIIYNDHYLVNKDYLLGTWKGTDGVNQYEIEVTQVTDALITLQYSFNCLPSGGSHITSGSTYEYDVLFASNYGTSAINIRLRNSLDNRQVVFSVNENDPSSAGWYIDGTIPLGKHQP